MDVIARVSRALDITEGHPAGHAARSCLIGMRLAHACGLDEIALGDLFHALLLKDVGCSSNAARLNSSRWLRRGQRRLSPRSAGRGAQSHARVLAVADVTDVLRSGRPYRPGLDIDRVTHMLSADADADADAGDGKMCPQSVAAMLDVLHA